MIRPFVPQPFQIDQYNGDAYLSIVFFKAKHSRLRKFPLQWSFPTFLQANLRTYVRFGEERGVYFFSLAANNPLVIKGGHLFQFPFHLAHMEWSKQGNDISFTCDRLLMNNNDLLKVFVTLEQTPFIPDKDSIQSWLTERFCIWYMTKKHLKKLPITHVPWVLYPANVSIAMKGSLEDNFITSESPLCYYASLMTAYAHIPEKHGLFIP